MTGSTTRSVLVVEDEPLIGMDLQHLLEESGYEVVGPATTIADAMHCTHNHALRAAVVDLNLDGELTGAVVSELLSLSVPVVLLTGYSSKTTVPPYNACPVVHKPYEPRNLLRIVDYVVDHPTMMPKLGGKESIRPGSGRRNIQGQ